jgi:hypothetical protein
MYIRWILHVRLLTTWEITGGQPFAHSSRGRRLLLSCDEDGSFAALYKLWAEWKD